jgi:hypothetical protein
MKKIDFKRQIWNNEKGRTFEDIKGYKFSYNDIQYGVYNTRENTCQYHKGYIAILICDNEKSTGLSFSNRTFRTIKECCKATMEIIDAKKKIILERMKEV